MFVIHWKDRKWTWFWRDSCYPITFGDIINLFLPNYGNFTQLSGMRLGRIPRETNNDMHAVVQQISAQIASCSCCWSTAGCLLRWYGKVLGKPNTFMHAHAGFYANSSTPTPCPPATPPPKNWSVPVNWRRLVVAEFLACTVWLPAGITLINKQKVTSGNTAVVATWLLRQTQLAARTICFAFVENSRYHGLRRTIITFPKKKKLGCFVELIIAMTLHYRDTLPLTSASAVFFADRWCAELIGQCSLVATRFAPANQESTGRWSRPRVW